MLKYAIADGFKSYILGIPELIFGSALVRRQIMQVGASLRRLYRGALELRQKRRVDYMHDKKAVNQVFKKSNELPVLFFGEQQSLENWLANNHDTSSGVWLQIAKKDSDVVSVSYDEALESALCYGWVDSQKKKFDEKTWLQRFTPRGPKSIWSKVNKEKAELLIANGRMKRSGFKSIETAKQNGYWDKAYESQSIASLPEDFANELEHNVKAKAFYNTLDKHNKYAILFRIHNAKKQETRAKRIQQFVIMLEKGEKIYP